MNRAHRGPRWWTATAVYRLALLAFPRDFRRRFGRQMRDAFVEHCQAARPGMVLVRAVEALIEALGQGFGERYQRFHRVRRVWGDRGESKSTPWGGNQMTWLAKDIRFALRSFRRNPLFTGTVLIVLALGIGANTAIFSLVNSLVFRGLPFEDAGQLVQVYETFQPESGPMERRSVAYPAYRDWREQTTVFAELAIRSFANVTVTGPDAAPALVGAGFVAPAEFRTFGAKPAVGRLLLDDDDRIGNTVAVLSHPTWQTRYGGSPDVVGSTITLNGVDALIVGVAEPGYGGPFGGLAVWLPVRAQGTMVTNRPPDILEERGVRAFGVMGRLRPGATIHQAQHEIDAISARLHEAGLVAPERAATVVSFEEEYLSAAQRTAFILAGAVGFVLLIACANVANLMLARQLSRGRELALRQALGAGRGAIARQLLVESLALGLGGGALGAVAAVWFTGAFGSATLGAVPGYIAPSTDVATLAFAVGVSALTGIVFGLLPAMKGSQVAVAETLKGSSRAMPGGASGSTARRVLVVAQVAIAVPLLIGAGLMIRSITNTLSVETGFDPTGVAVAQVNLPAADYDRAARVEFARRLEQDLVARTGITHAAVASDLPLNSGYSAQMVTVEEPEFADERFRVFVHSVSPGYFETLGIRVVSGRAFDLQDGNEGRPAVIVSQEMAERFWPNRDPVGRTVSGAQVVGVVEDAVFRSLVPDPVNDPNDPDVFLPIAARATPRMQIAVRGSIPEAQLPDVIRAAVNRLDATLPVYGVTTLETIVGTQVAANRAATRQLGAFAGIALVLAATGLFGVMAYTVSQKTGEIGVRVALGANRGRVMQLVMRQGVGLVVMGLVAGIGVAAGLGRVLESQLYGVATTDLATYLAVAAVFALVGLVACAVPALRATRVDPLTALRAE